MPVLTRSCSKQKGRPRIEDETPTTTDTNRRRYTTRSSAKRKIIEQENEGKALEPPSKRAASSRSSNNVPKSAKNMPLQEIKNTINQGKHDHTKSSKGHESRIPRRHCNNNVSKNNKTDLTQSNKKLVNNTTDNDNSQKNITHRSPPFEQSDFNLNSVPADNEAVPKTPAGCIAARIRSYSALRRSQRKKRGQVHSDGDKANLGCSPTSTMSPSEEISSNQSMAMEMENSNNSELRSDVESDEDILWKMSKKHIDEKEDTIPEDKSDDESSYKNKYFTLMTAMKQLQNTFLRAQQNAERNVKAYDNFVSNLKPSLSTEKQKNSLLSEELKIKKGTVERLRSDLENTKEQLEYMKEEKANTEKHDQEKSEKEKDSCGKGLETNDKELLQLVEDQRRMIKFYSQLTGITLSQENTCEDASSFQSFNCTFYPAANNPHCVQFRLTHDKEFDEIEYSPNPQSPGSEDVLMSLPNYLQENIFFGADQAPRFLAKLLKTVE